MGTAPSPTTPTSASAGSFDELAERLQAVRERIGDTNTLRPQPSGHEPIDATVVARVIPAGPPAGSPSGSGAPATLRFPRIGWDLVLLAGAWAGMLAVVVGLLV